MIHKRIPVEIIILSLILILAAWVRLYRINSTPSLYWEETALGYDAYSIWETGKDFHGNRFPLVAFESFGDYKPSLYFYVAAPFVGILGISEWSVRLPSALAGIVTVALVFLLAKKMMGVQAGLWSAMILAIMPWHIQFSRAAFEVNLGTMLLTWGVYLLLKAKEKSGYILGGAALLAISTYAYHGLRILSPLLAIWTIMMLPKKIWHNKSLYFAGVLAAIMMMPIMIKIQSPEVLQRYRETSLFSTSSAVVRSNSDRAEDGGGLISRLIHHRYVYWTVEILSGIVKQISPDFLFITGDNNNRHQTGYSALLLWVSLLPLAIALTNPNRKSGWLVGWVLLAAIPPALTNLTPHTLRFLPAAPAMAILIGYGASIIANKKVAWGWGLLTLCLINFGVYFFDYFTRYQVSSAADWQYGYKEVVKFVNEYQDKNMPVQVTRAYGRPSMYFLFYSKYDPNKVQMEAVREPKDQGELLAFSRYTFGQFDMNKKSLIVNNKPLVGPKLVKLINFPNHLPAFYIYEN